MIFEAIVFGHLEPRMYNAEAQNKQLSNLKKDLTFVIECQFYFKNAKIEHYLTTKIQISRGCKQM